MAEFPNNQFSHDTIAEHIVRVRMCVTGMTNHPEAAFRGDLVVKMTAHRDTFETLEVQHGDEWGDEEAATAYTNLCEDALSAKLSSARYMIESMIEEEEIAPVAANDLRREFGIVATKPRDRDGMVKLAIKMTKTNARYVLEVSPYALPEDFFLDMETKMTALINAMDAHAKELNERLTIGDAKLVERDRGDVLLSNAFKWLVALYGEDANVLLEFGFVPKSQIWTPGSGDPEPPPEPLTPWPGPALFEVENIGGGTVELRPKLIEDMVDGTIERRIDPAGEWEMITESTTIEDGKVIPHRDLNSPMGMMIEYKFTPLNAAMEKGLETVTSVMVE